MLGLQVYGQNPQRAKTLKIQNPKRVKIVKYTKFVKAKRYRSSRFRHITIFSFRDFDSLAICLFGIWFLGFLEFWILAFGI